MRRQAKMLSDLKVRIKHWNKILNRHWKICITYVLGKWLSDCCLNPNEQFFSYKTGKNVVRSKSQMSAAMGGVKEGHIYVPVAKSMCCYCTLPVFDAFPCFSPFFCLNNFVAFINVHCFVARVHRVWYQLV
jgi:hypothetical protein